MGIKNYTTGVSADVSLVEIQRMLLAHEADSISVRYDADRTPVALAFGVATPMGDRQFVLPANVAGVLATMQRDGLPARYANKEHARSVAWRIVRDWLAAQLALIDAGGAALDQVFLPYMLTDGGKILYEVMLEKHGALPSEA